LISLFSSLAAALIGLAQSEVAQAAACCGGTVAAPNIIGGDDRTQIAFSLSRAKIAADVNEDGIWRERQASELSDSLRIEGAHVLSDRLQLGGAVPVIARTRDFARSSGLGDVSVDLAYEYLPEWEYNPYRPKGIGYFQLTIPTGKSVYEDTSGIDARGRGFWAIGLGTLLTKTLGNWDGAVSFDLHRSFNKTVHTPLLDGTIKPGFGGGMSIGLGYNWARWRAGGTLAWTYEDPIQIESAATSTGSLQRLVTATISLSYLYNDEWSMTASVSDQTLFGSPLNTSLNRSAMLLLLRRWPL
jgi:hypothetical protein